MFMVSCKEPVGNTNTPVNIPVKAPHKDFILLYYGDFDNGKKLFRMHCRACHSVNDDRCVGPGMKGLFTRTELNEDALKKYFLKDDLHPIQFIEVLSDQEANDIIYFLYNNTIVG